MSAKPPKLSQYIIVQAKALRAVAAPMLAEMQKQTAVIERIATALEEGLFRLGEYVAK